MIFNSINFILFFTTVLIVLYVLPAVYRWVWVLAASIFFYAFARPAYTFVPIAITALSYFAGLAIEKAPTDKKKQSLFTVSVIAIIGTLVFFKYSNFFTNAFTDLFNLFSTKDSNNSLLLNIAA